MESSQKAGRDSIRCFFMKRYGKPFVIGISNNGALGVLVSPEVLKEWTIDEWKAQMAVVMKYFCEQCPRFQLIRLDFGVMSEDPSIKENTSLFSILNEP